ncbi:MAG: hypothetical protein ACOH2A_12510 [Sphingobacteriaceae bacterium]
MKYLQFFSLLTLPCFLLLACNSSPVQQQSDDSLVRRDIIPDSSKLCFQHTENRDTSSIQLIISGSLVEGKFSSVPFEKDARRGNIRGTKQGDIIKGLWRYMQEGVIDSLDVEFKLKDNQLLQKEFSVDKQTGREVLESSASFNILFSAVDCEELP